MLHFIFIFVFCAFFDSSDLCASCFSPPSFDDPSFTLDISPFLSASDGYQNTDMMPFSPLSPLDSQVEALSSPVYSQSVGMPTQPLVPLPRTPQNSFEAWLDTLCPQPEQEDTLPKSRSLEVEALLKVTPVQMKKTAQSSRVHKTHEIPAYKNKSQIKKQKKISRLLQHKDRNQNLVQIGQCLKRQLAFDNRNLNRNALYHMYFSHFLPFARFYNKIRRALFAFDLYKDLAKEYMITQSYSNDMTLMLFNELRRDPSIKTKLLVQLIPYQGAQLQDIERIPHGLESLICDLRFAARWQEAYGSSLPAESEEPVQNEIDCLRP